MAPGTDWRPLDPVTAGIIGLGAEMARLLDAVCRRAGSLTFSQYQLLGALRATAPDPMEPWEIGRDIGAGSAQVTTLLDQLERAGLVVRAPHPQDRRRRLVHLTGQGVARVEGVARQVGAAERVVVGRALSSEEAHRTAADARRLREVLRELSAADRSFLLTADPGHEPAPGG